MRVEGGTPAPRCPGRRRRPAPRCTMELALCPPPPASRPRRAGSRFHVTCTKKRNGFWGRLRTPLSRAPSSGLQSPPLSPPPRQVGDPRRAHLGSGRSPRGAQVTRAARPRQLRARGPLRPAALCAGSGLAGGRGAVQRAGASERASRRLGLPFAHFLDSRHDPLDIIFGPAPGLGSNRPARHGSGGEGERGERERLGERARRVLLATLARSLTRAQTHTHTHTRTHKAWCRRAPGAQCASAGRQLHRARGSGAAASSAASGCRRPPRGTAGTSPRETIG